MGWNLSSSQRYEEIRSTVADIIEDWGITVYPFSVWQLLNKMGIKVIRYSSVPEKEREELMRFYPDAFTIYPSDFAITGITIFYNDYMDRARIRFSLAHELGHLILMHPDTNEEVYEHEADIFANYFLAPAPLVLRDSELDPDAISHDFRISYSCACSVMDRSRNRAMHGPRTETEYEYRILSLCVLGGDGYLADV